MSADRKVWSGANALPNITPNGCVYSGDRNERKTALIRGGFGLYPGKVLVYLQTGRKLPEAPDISLIKE